MLLSTHIQTRFTYNGHIVHFSPISPKIKVYDHMPILEFIDTTYFFSKAMWGDFKAIRRNIPSGKIVIRNELCYPRSGPFSPYEDPDPRVESLIETNSYLKFVVVFRREEMDQGYHSYPFIAWRFPIKHLQFRVRLFLTRRRRVRRLALAMALHARLGADSPVSEWLNEDMLRKICTEV